MPMTEKLLDDSQPDNFGTQLVSMRYDQSGLLVNKIQAATIKHYPVSDVTWLTKPRLWSYDRNKNVDWHALSNLGKILADHNTFSLLGNVLVTQSATENHPEIRLKTNKMTLYSKGRNTFDANTKGG